MAAAGSVALNIYGNWVQAQRKVELQRKYDAEREYLQQQEQLRSVISRYRGPLLEASIDLEQRLFHLITRSGECGGAVAAGLQLEEEEVQYTTFTIAQFLGFVEVVRREGPREQSFLTPSEVNGTSQLMTLVESFKFTWASHSHSLDSWYAQANQAGSRDHPGARHRQLPLSSSSSLREEEDRGASEDGRSARQRGQVRGSGPQPLLRISRGQQRAIGSFMITSSAGALRHYTMSYSKWLQAYASEPEFAALFDRIMGDIKALATGPPWQGEPAMPLGRWSRLLLLQQLLIDTADLLDPDYTRVVITRRLRLAPVTYDPLPNLEQYKQRLSQLYSSTVGEAPRFAALDNLAGQPAAAAARGQALLPPAGKAADKGQGWALADRQQPLLWDDSSLDSADQNDSPPPNSSRTRRF